MAQEAFATAPLKRRRERGGYAKWPSQRVLGISRAHCSALVLQGFACGPLHPSIGEFAGEALSPPGCAPLARDATAGVLRQLFGDGRLRKVDLRHWPMVGTLALTGLVNSAMGGCSAGDTARA